MTIANCVGIRWRDWWGWTRGWACRWLIWYYVSYILYLFGYICNSNIIFCANNSILVYKIHESCVSALRPFSVCLCMRFLSISTKRNPSQFQLFHVMHVHIFRNIYPRGRRFYFCSKCFNNRNLRGSSRCFGFPTNDHKTIMKGNERKWEAKRQLW